MIEPKPFTIAATPSRRIPVDGPPATILPEWGGVTRTRATSFILHPPTDYEIAYQVDRVVVFVPFSSGASDRAIGEGPLRRVRVRSGAATFLPAGVLVRVVQREPIEFLILSIDPLHAQAVADHAAAGRPWSFAVLEDLSDPAVTALAAEMRRSLLVDPQAETGYLQLLADALLARLVCWLIAEGDGAREAESARPGESLSPGKLRQLVRAIEDRLSGPLRVEDLAVEAGLSRSHFSRAFQRVTGMSPQAYILERRICRARDLISAGAVNLSEVAARAGFASHAHMSTAFRKALGVSPSRYREAFARRS